MAKPATSPWEDPKIPLSKHPGDGKNQHSKRIWSSWGANREPGVAKAATFPWKYPRISLSRHAGVSAGALVSSAGLKRLHCSPKLNLGFLGQILIQGSWGCSLGGAAGFPTPSGAPGFSSPPGQLPPLIPSHSQPFSGTFLPSQAVRGGVWGEQKVPEHPQNPPGAGLGPGGAGQEGLGLILPKLIIP